MITLSHSPHSAPSDFEGLAISDAPATPRESLIPLEAVLPDLSAAMPALSPGVSHGACLLLFPLSARAGGGGKEWAEFKTQRVARSELGQLSLVAT